MADDQATHETDARIVGHNESQEALTGLASRFRVRARYPGLTANREFLRLRRDFERSALLAEQVRDLNAAIGDNKNLGPAGNPLRLQVEQTRLMGQLQNALEERDRLADELGNLRGNDRSGHPDYAWSGLTEGRAPGAEKNDDQTRPVATKRNKSEPDRDRSVGEQLLPVHPAEDHPPRRPMRIMRIRKPEPVSDGAAEWNAYVRQRSRGPTP